MSLTLLGCRCHNSEPLLRKVLRESHVDGWATRPIIKGKEACLNYLSTLPETEDTGSLFLYLKRSSSWSVVLGEKDGTYRWVDVGHATVKDKLDAEIILENFV